tara:strand:+ start:593 stop:907 length:315 start_codon:yes stop_codon:yes gene_type:complete
MINSGREWDWIDDNSTIGEALRGWGFDMNGLKEGEGALSSLPPKATRAFSTKVSNDIPGFEGTMEQLNDLSIYRKDSNPSTEEGIPANEWCYYAGMPSPTAYEE